MDNNIKIRIQKLMELEQLNPASFAKAIQVNPSAISHILNDRNKPSTEIIIKVLNTFRSLSSDWLILGIGSMYRNEKNIPNQAQSPSLFDTSIEESPITSVEEPIYESTPITSQIRQPEAVKIEKELKDVTVSKSSKILNKIIVYYSDNSFEEFMSLNQ